MTQIPFRNNKFIKDCDLELSKYNLFTGLNCSGKTRLIDEIIKSKKLKGDLVIVDLNNLDYQDKMEELFYSHPNKDKVSKIFYELSDKKPKVIFEDDERKLQFKCGNYIFDKNEIGSGTYKYFILLCSIYFTEDNKIYYYDKFENQLHPKLQNQITELLFEVTKDKNSIFLIESHSDHILYSFRIAIKEKLIELGDSKIYNTVFKEKVNPIYIELDQYGRMERKVRRYYRTYERHLYRLMS